MWNIFFFWKVFYKYNTTPQLWIIQSIIDANIDIIKLNINNKFLRWIGESHGRGDWGAYRALGTRCFCSRGKADASELNHSIVADWIGFATENTTKLP